MPIQAGGNSVTIKNCTLEDIGNACLVFQRIELYELKNDSVAGYARNLTNGTGVVGGPLPNWINDTLEQCQHELPAAAITLLRTIK